MKNSSATNASSADDADNVREAPAAPIDVWLPPPRANAEENNSGQEDGDDGFVLVKRLKHRGTPPPQEEQLPTAEVSFPPNREFVHKDPFGLAGVSMEVNPVTVRHMVHARTKQTLRRPTSKGAGSGTKTSPPESSSGSNSDHSRARLWQKGLQEKAAAAAKKTNPFIKRALDFGATSDGWETVNSESDGEERAVQPPAPEAPKAIVKSRPPAPKVVEIEGRFNGRVHPTPGQGYCGPASLLAALQHLARTRGYVFAIPDDALALRQAIVDYIAENLDARASETIGEGGAVETLREAITREYFPDDPQACMANGRHNLWVPDVDEEAPVFLENMSEYIEAIGYARTHIDEFMLTAFARMWEVRVAVFHYQGRSLTSEHTQYVPESPVEAARTVFLVHGGSHFEWALLQGNREALKYKGFIINDTINQFQ